MPLSNKLYEYWPPVDCLVMNQQRIAKISAILHTKCGNGEVWSTPAQAFITDLQNTSLCSCPVKLETSSE